jgi:hypothetical protein
MDLIKADIIKKCSYGILQTSTSSYCQDLPYGNNSRGMEFEHHMPYPQKKEI